MLRKTAETVLGVTFGKRKGDRKTWWWNEKVQESIKEKKEAKKAWDKTRNENTKKIYKEKKNKAKKAVAMAKERAYDNLYVSRTLFGNPKGPVELGNPNTCAETKLCLNFILFRLKK